jgi:hypothetical protein
MVQTGKAQAEGRDQGNHLLGLLDLVAAMVRHPGQGLVLAELVEYCPDRGTKNASTQSSLALLRMSRKGSTFRQQH